MCFLVMSLCSCDVITIRGMAVRRLTGLTCSKVPGFWIVEHQFVIYVSLQFSLRGVQEQYDLTIAQLVCSQPDTIIYNSDIFYLYTELV